MSSTQVNAFIDTDTQVDAMRSGTGTVYVNIDSLTLFLATPEHTKAGALAVLARLTAAVEALPDDTHAGQGVLPTETLTRFCKYGDTIQKPCTHAECRPGYVPDLLGALDRSIQQARADRAAAVEALPDDTHAGQGVLPTAGFVQPMESPYSTTSSPTITAPMTTESPLCVSADVGSYRSMQILCTKPAEHEGEHENGEYTWPDPVWRTLTFGDLRVGDVVRLDEDGDEETVRASWPDRVPGYWWYRGSKTCGRPHNTDPVLVRHPRPEVGQ